MGFSKLGDYGLVLTPEGRLLSTRPAVLDDGFGGKIVGWREGDLAAMELARWQSPPATPRATANASAIPAPMPAAPSTRTVVARPPIPTRPPVATLASPVLAMAPLGPKRAPTPLPLETQPMIRVDEFEKMEAEPLEPLEPLEDEWEWEIAVARARAQAEWADEALAQQTQVAATPALRPAPPAVPAPVAPALRIRAKSQTSPITPVKPPIADRWDTSDRTKTAISAAPAPLPRITQPTRPVQIVSPQTQPGRTVIPVPTITQVTDPSQIQPRRFPRATGLTNQTNQMNQTVVGEDTQVTLAAPANDDLTSPGLLAAPSSNHSSNAKRVAAKQR